ncbi:MAG: MEDS domain-containing protein [Nitrososphaera sp.]
MKQTLSAEAAVDEVKNAKFGSHFLLTYPDIESWQKLYLGTTEKFLKVDNSLVMIIPFFETTSNVRSRLQSQIKDLEKYESEGSLVIIDSVKAYFSEIGLMTFVDELRSHARAKKKRGISVLADMASFNHMQKMHQIVEHEVSLPAIYDSDMRGFCIYRDTNMDDLSNHQKDLMYQHHSKNLFIE